MSKELRTWGLLQSRCAECCNGDRCDDPTHLDRSKCPHCKSTGYALWKTAGRAAFLDHRLKVGKSFEEARQELHDIVGDVPVVDLPETVYPISDERIIEIRKATRPASTAPWSDTLAFAHALLDELNKGRT